jgi:hypothetical protein
MRLPRQPQDAERVSPEVRSLLSEDATAHRRQFYASVGELMRRYSASPLPPTDPARTPLTGCELKVFSQNGEDGVLAELLRRVGSGSRSFLEIGAGQGTEGTCVALADLLGFGGVFVEGDPQRHARLQRKYAHRADVVCANEIVTPGNVAALVEQWGVAREIDVLAIDVDGRDWWLWHALDALTPRIVVVEYNAGLGFEQARTVPLDHAGGWDGTDYFGASLPAFEQLGRERGYRLVHTEMTGVNAFFALERLAADWPDDEVVPRTHANYGLSGRGHAPDPRGRPYVAPPVAGRR